MFENEIVVSLYNMACTPGGIRAGMDGILMGRMNPGDALRVLDLYDSDFTSEEEKKRTFELMITLDRAATDQQQIEEQKHRDRIRPKG